MNERLQKILARAGFASRRGAEQLMLEGRVTVNGAIVKELGSRADLGGDDVRVDGVRVKAPKAPAYLVLFKPRGVVTTRKDPEGRQTVMDLVPKLAGLFPIGRLDVTTEGLILLTNDGAFAERVSHPRYEVPRVYNAKVHGVPDERALERLRNGVELDGERMAADRVRVLESDKNAWVEVTLHEGKQHEVRRLLEAVGHPVSKLRRVSFGPVTVRGLEPGQSRALTPEEIAGLLRGQAAPAAPVAKRRRRPVRRAQPAQSRGEAAPPRPGTTRPSPRPPAAAGAGATRVGSSPGRTAARPGAGKRPTERRPSGPRRSGPSRGKRP